jgi:hypothetical protein
MSDEEILKKYKLEIKQAINEIIKEYNMTDPARMELVGKKYKGRFVVGFKEGKVEP